MNPKEGNELTSLIVALHVGPPSAETDAKLEQENSPPKNQDLKGILLRSSDVFLHWRYLYEKGSVGEYVVYEYKFGRLGLIAEVLRAYAVGALSKRIQARQSGGVSTKR
jgi:hypothetical protein